jgi:hypothetical protein
MKNAASENSVSGERALTQLAGKGDPFAFYAIVAEHSQVAYASLRASGEKHDEACALLLSLYIRLYHLYCRGAMHKALGVWIDEHIASHLKKAAGPAGAVAPALAYSEREGFAARLQLEFQREYSATQRSDRRRPALSGAAHFLHRHPVGKRLVTVTLAVLMIGALYLYLKTADSQVALSYSSSYIKTLFVFPPGPEGMLVVQSLMPITVTSVPVSLKPINQKPDTAAERPATAEVHPAVPESGAGTRATTAQRPLSASTIAAGNAAPPTMPRPATVMPVSAASTASSAAPQRATGGPPATTSAAVLQRAATARTPAPGGMPRDTTARAIAPRPAVRDTGLARTPQPAGQSPARTSPAAYGTSSASGMPARTTPPARADTMAR